MDYTPVPAPGVQPPPRTKYTGFPVFLLVVLVLKLLNSFAGLIPALAALGRLQAYESMISVVGNRMITIIPVLLMIVGASLHKKGMQPLFGAGIILETVFTMGSALLSFSSGVSDEVMVRNILPVLGNLPILIFSIFIALYYILKGKGMGSKAVKIVFCALSLGTNVFVWFFSFALEIGLSMETSIFSSSVAVQNVLALLMSMIVTTLFYIALMCYSPFKKVQ